MQAFPFRMTALNMAKHRNNPHFAFWKMLKEGYDHFEATRVETKVAVCERRYVYDAAAPDGATKALTFNAKGACPVYQLDKNVADAVLEQRRQEQFKMAKYMAEGVQTVAFRTGTDGGMNPVFASKLGTQEAYDIKGNLIQVATAPGSLPRDNGNIPQTTITVPKAAPTQVASTSAPEATTTSARSQPPTSIGGLIGNVSSRQRAAAYSFRCLSAPAKHSSSIGVRTMP
jgi:hypothetical protein